MHNPHVDYSTPTLVGQGELRIAFRHAFLMHCIQKFHNVLAPRLSNYRANVITTWLMKVCGVRIRYREYGQWHLIPGCFPD